MKNRRRNAVKIIRSSDIEKLSQLKNEFFNLIELESEFIIKAYEMFYTSNKCKLYIIMEFEEDLQNLSTVVSLRGPLNEEQARKIFIKLLNGIIDCHKKGVCHR